MLKFNSGVEVVNKTVFLDDAIEKGTKLYTYEE